MSLCSFWSVSAIACDLEAFLPNIEIDFDFSWIGDFKLVDGLPKR